MPTVPLSSLSYSYRDNMCHCTDKGHSLTFLKPETTISLHPEVNPYFTSPNLNLFKTKINDSSLSYDAAANKGLKGPSSKFEENTEKDSRAGMQGWYGRDQCVCVRARAREEQRWVVLSVATPFSFRQLTPV